MEKYNPTPLDSDDSRSSNEYENAAFLNSQVLKDEKKRKQFLWLTFFNMFLFVISALTLVCTTVSQRSPSIHAAAKLMNEFGIFCTQLSLSLRHLAN